MNKNIYVFDATRASVSSNEQPLGYYFCRFLYAGGLLYSRYYEFQTPEVCLAPPVQTHNHRKSTVKLLGPYLSLDTPDGAY